MPAIGDYITPLLKRIYDLHAVSTFAAAVTWRDLVRPSNRLSRHNLQPWTATKPMNRASPSENPEADFRLDRTGALPGYRPPVTFCATAGGQRPMVGEQHTFQIVLNHIGSSYARAMQIHAMTRAILINAGEKLKLDGANPIVYVAGVADIMGRIRDKQNQNDRPFSFVQTIEIPVNVMLRAADLTG